MKALPVKGASAREWASRIVDAWRKSVESIIETGSLLNEAKDALPHGEWLSMVADLLPFGPRKAQMLMAIARDERLAKTQTISLLPPSWPVLYELTKLDDQKFAAMLREGSIKPDMTKIVVDSEAWLATHRKFARIKNLPKKAKKAPPKGLPKPEAKPAAPSRPQPIGAETAQDLLRFLDRLVERLRAMPSNIAVAPRFALLSEDRRKMAELATEAINVLSRIYDGASRDGGGL